MSTTTLTFTGWDRPGITAELLGSLGEDVVVRDIEQLVVQGRLVLSVAVDTESVNGVRERARRLNMELDVTTGCRDVVDRHAATASAVLMAPELTAVDLRTIAGEIAARSGNIERIVRTAEYPVTAIEMSVSGVPAVALKQALAPIATGMGVDIAVQSADIIRQGARLVVMDVDSTLIQDEVIDLLAERPDVKPRWRMSQPGRWPANWTSRSRCGNASRLWPALRRVLCRPCAKRFG